MSPEPSARGREYETAQLIPYLGNKRSLTPRLRELFQGLAAGESGRVFLDPFAGAGSVSRLARSLGFKVRSNDWEPYAFAVNSVWLRLRPSDLDGMFRDLGGIQAALNLVNAFHPERENRKLDPDCEPYLSRWYAPKDTARADWRTERLFYTRENAIFLDRVRDYIDRRGFSACLKESGGHGASEDRLLLGLLVLEAATHANTSGVFKAFHKGFGGHGGDALPRILGPMQLEPPILSEAEPAEVYREDAADFVRRFPADIAYLDPPYNQHQYGSNYHLLNTLVRWDREPVPLDVGSDGRLLCKAGIPPAWKETRSPYCGRATAQAALADLLDRLDAGTIVFSYNTEGIIEPKELYEMLSERWDVETEILDYVRYRGGRQSDARRVRNHELVFVGKPRGSGRSRSSEDALGPLLAELRLRRLLSSRFDPEEIRKRFRVRAGALEPGNGRGAWRMWRCFRFEAGNGERRVVSEPSEWEGFLANLEACEIRDNARAVAVLASIARDSAGQEDCAADARRASREAVSTLRKLAHPRYLSEYGTARDSLWALAREHPALRDVLEPGLLRLEAQRQKRLENA